MDAYFAKRRLRNKNFTVISNNCIAGCILHDLGMRFDTPTINLFIPFPDFIQFLRNLKENLTKEIVDISGDSPYPIGLMGGANPYSFFALQRF